MTLRNSVLLLVILSAIAASVACSNSSAAPGPLTVILNEVNTPATVNSRVPVSATVLSDPANAGVSWSCTPTPGCGSFSSLTSASGASNDYIAPPVVPSSAVVIIAASVTTPSQSASSQAITITTAALPSGTYVFNLSGIDNGSASAGNPSPYFVVGQFTYNSATGVGITGGEQDFFDYNVGPQMDAITGGTVTTTSDGNIQITLTTLDTSIGVGGTETLNAALIPFPASSTTALLNEYDSSASGSGELDVQDSTAATTEPSGGYAFTLAGYDGGANVFAMGGVLNVDNAIGAGDIDGNGSVFDANDSDNAAASSGGLYLAQTFADSTVSAPDAAGRVTFTLNPTDSADFPQIILAGYIVDGNRIRLLETTDTYAGANQGIAYSQGANVDTFTTTNLSGNTYVAGMIGNDSVGVLQTATQLTANADGSVAGFFDFNDLSTPEPISPDPVSAPAASYTVDLTGRVAMPNVADASATVTLNFQGYLDGNNHLLLLSMTSGYILNGIADQQPAGALGTFAASNLINGYALGVTGFDSITGAEFDAVGAVAADGVGTTTGFADINWLSSGPNFPNETVTGTFVSNADGIFSGAITGLNLADCTFANPVNMGCSNDVFNYYLIDTAGDAIVIETDANQLTTGRLEGQQ